jgi:hypothetical protein
MSFPKKIYKTEKKKGKIKNLSDIFTPAGFEIKKTNRSGEKTFLLIPEKNPLYINLPENAENIRIFYASENPQYKGRVSFDYKGKSYMVIPFPEKD